MKSVDSDLISYYVRALRIWSLFLGLQTIDCCQKMENKRVVAPTIQYRLENNKKGKPSDLNMEHLQRFERPFLRDFQEILIEDWRVVERHVFDLLKLGELSNKLGSIKSIDPQIWSKVVFAAAEIEIDQSLYVNYVG